MTGSFFFGFVPSRGINWWIRMTSKDIGEVLSKGKRKRAIGRMGRYMYVPTQIMMSMGEIDIFFMKDRSPLKWCSYKSLILAFFSISSPLSAYPITSFLSLPHRTHSLPPLLSLQSKSSPPKNSPCKT